MTDWVSLVNQWCQKNNHPSPEYRYRCTPDSTAQNPEWFCIGTSSLLVEPVLSPVYTTKKCAKQSCAESIYQQLQNACAIALKGNDCCIMIDGDQRADCWKWLASENTLIEGCTIKVYTSPTTPRVSSDKPIEHICSASPSRDAADAKMLMDLGAFIALQQYTSYIIVSSDHILVQAAIDTPNVEVAANLAGLKQLFV